MYDRYEYLLNNITKSLFPEYKVTNVDHFKLKDNIGLIKLPDDINCYKLILLIDTLYQTFEIKKIKLNISSGYWDDIVTIHDSEARTCIVITVIFN